MDAAPKSGRPVFLVGLIGPGIPLVVGAFWHHTRKWGGSAMRWVDASHWRVIDQPYPVPFEPQAWTRFQ